MDDPPKTATGPSKGAMRGFTIVAVVAVIAVVGLVAWALWTTTRPSKSPQEPSFDRFQPAWSSAMGKAGVEATFPAAPVDLKNVTPNGRHSFEATFTAAELTALLNVYRHTERVAGAEVEVRSATIEVADDGQLLISGTLTVDGTVYQAQAAAPVTYSRGRLRSPGLTALTVEGFGIGGGRRDQAGDALIKYFDSYIDAAPGLTIESAEPVKGGVKARGFAPIAIEQVAGG